MSEYSKIEWCDHTWNAWEGCQKAGPGCDHCYAESRNARYAGGVAANFGPGAPRRRTSPANWRKPERWSRAAFWECGCCGWRGFETDMSVRDDGFGAWAGCPRCRAGAFASTRQRVFCSSLSDWLDNAVDIAWFVDLLQQIRYTPELDWLLLSKRIGNWKGRMVAALKWVVAQGKDQQLAAWISEWLDGSAPANVLIGATVVNQQEADRDIPKLLCVPARQRFLSMEPLLGPVDLTRIELAGGDLELFPLTGTDRCVDEEGEPAPDVPALDWVIVGGESGPQARPMHPDWVRDLRDQCLEAGVAFTFKQWGEWAPGEVCGPMARAERTAHFFGGEWSFGTMTPQQSEACHADDAPDLFRVGKRLAGRMLDGHIWSAFPHQNHTTQPEVN